jgi:hypothetical protein
LVFGKLGVLAPSDRATIISRLCHAYGVFPKSLKEASAGNVAHSSSSKPKSVPGQTTQGGKTQEPKPENEFLKETRLGVLLKASSKLLKANTDDSVQPSESLGRVHGILTKKMFEAKNLLRPYLGVDSIPEDSQRAIDAVTMGAADANDPPGENLVYAAMQRLSQGEEHQELMVDDEVDRDSIGASTLVMHHLQCLIQGQWPDETPDYVRKEVDAEPPPGAALQRRRTPESAQERQAKLEARRAKFKASKADRQADRKRAGTAPPAKSQRKKPPTDADKDPRKEA